jgi:hypothetical protein
VPVVPLRWVLVRDPAGAFDTQARLCTALAVAPEQILAWFVQRWQLEVTLEAARRHLGVETPRHWSDLAIGRPTPVWLGLFSLVTRFAQQRRAGAAGQHPAGGVVSESSADLQPCPGATPA